ncbi:MAG: hypothetical protein ACI837_003386 [Crocinitomicaceae bacterium]
MLNSYLSAVRMPKIVRLIPLIVSSLVCLYNIITPLFSTVEHNGIRITIVHGNALLLGLLGLSIVWLSLILKRNIWALLYLLFLLFCWSPYVQFTNFEVTIHFFTLRIDVIALVFISAHLIMNIDIMIVQDKETEKALEDKESDSKDLSA